MTNVTVVSPSGAQGIAKDIKVHDKKPRKSGKPAPPPMLSRLMLATMIVTVMVGLPVDRLGGIPGQLAVSFWTWALFLVLLARINQQLRFPLMLCLVISTVGEFCLSLLWGLYVYWLHNVPFFVPPGHVLLFALGLTFAPRLPQWAVILVAACLLYTSPSPRD